MKHKNEALQIYNQWKKDVQTVFRLEVGWEDHSESYINWVRSDGGTEYVNKAFRDQLKIDGKVPYQVLFNRQVDPTLFRPFGCPAYAYTDRKSTRLNSSHHEQSRMPSSA